MNDAAQEGGDPKIVSIGGSPESRVSLQDIQAALIAVYGATCDGEEIKDDDDV
jgi:hypothetical protein